jgi:predicted aspartyl protease
MAFRSAALGFAVLAIFTPAQAAAGECLAAGGQAPISHDVAGRAAAPVRVNGSGPYRFVVDTGANRSALSTDLARRLGIVPFGMGEVHSIEGVQLAPLANVRALEFGALSLAGRALPLIDGPMRGGESGLLGVDGMGGRRLQMDFAGRCVEIVNAASAPPLTGWRTAQGRLRFGSLMVAEGSIHGVRVSVLIDTGSDVSLANRAFKTALGRVRADYVETHGERAFTAGRPVLLHDAVWAPRVHVGDVWMSNVMAYVGDFHIFDLWGLSDTPTLLVGMDVLAQSNAMAIDYERGLVHFRDAPHGRW